MNDLMPTRLLALSSEAVLRLKLKGSGERENPQLMEIGWGFVGDKSLTMSYFHTGVRTIIGAKSFHCPVRYGKEWYQLAMVIRHNCLMACPGDKPSNS